MPVEIKVPSVGESITEGILSRWIKKNGDFVKADEPIVELETDKATQEIYAPASGRLRTSAVEGSTVQVGSVIGSVEEGVAAPASVIQAPKVPTQPQTKAEVSSPAPAAQPPVQPKSTASIQPALSPAARVLAEARGVDPEKLTGSGRGGRIIKEDVLSAATALALAGNGSIPTAAATTTVKIVERETRQRMSAIRLRIAARLIESQQSTASLTTFNEIDMSAVMDLRARHKERFKEKHGVNLGFMSFFLKAAVESLKAYPLVNARIDGADIVFQHFYDIGVAVSTEKGLMVPVVRDCDHKSFADIERDISGFAAKARDGKINVSDLQGGTFTVTNGGTFGSLLSTPILNPPQTAILGMHAIQKRPVVRGDQVVIRPMMYVALTYDHRLIDGREAVYFLIRIKECVENPERLMLEI